MANRGAAYAVPCRRNGEGPRGGRPRRAPRRGQIKAGIASAAVHSVASVLLRAIHGSHVLVSKLTKTRRRWRQKCDAYNRRLWRLMQLQQLIKKLDHEFSRLKQHLEKTLRGLEEKNDMSRSGRGR